MSQVERRVVSQLALAHERQLISRGCALRLTVQNAGDTAELTRSGSASRRSQDTPTGAPAANQNPPLIKLMLVGKNSKADSFIDLGVDFGGVHTF